MSYSPLAAPLSELGKTTRRAEKSEGEQQSKHVESALLNDAKAPPLQPRLRRTLYIKAPP